MGVKRVDTAAECKEAIQPPMMVMVVMMLMMVMMFMMMVMMMMVMVMVNAMKKCPMP